MLRINEFTASKIIEEYELKRKEYYATGGHLGPNFFPHGLEAAARVCEDAIAVKNKFGGEVDIILSDSIVKDLV